MTKECEQALKLAASLVAIVDSAGRMKALWTYDDRFPTERIKTAAGKPWTDLFAPPPRTPKFKQCRQPGDFTIEPDVKYLTVFENRFIEWRFSRFSDEDGDDQCLMGVGMDVSSHVLDAQRLRKEMESQLQHADRLATVGQLAAGIAHELNGPLSNILGFAQLAAKQQDLPEQVYSDLDNIVRFSLHTREIVKKIMLFSRQMPPRRESVSLNAVIGDSLHFTEPLCNKNKIKVICRFQDNLPDLQADPSQLHQVLINLIVNAAQAMPSPGGKIFIETGQTGETELFMSVEDTGSGMESETLEKCFLPFFTTKDVDKGTGLGLSVVHGIVESHGGKIRAESEPGQGACFTIHLPAVQATGDIDV